METLTLKCDEAGQKLLVYFALALDCAVPILEALFCTSLAKLAWNGNNYKQLVEMFVDVMLSKITLKTSCLPHPAWPRTNNSTNYIGWKENPNWWLSFNNTVTFWIITFANGDKQTWLECTPWNCIRIVSTCHQDETKVFDLIPWGRLDATIDFHLNLVLQ